MTRVLITGGRGLLGREVVRRLAAQTVAFTTFRQPADPADAGEALALDLRDRRAVGRAFEAWCPEVVIHTAAPRGADSLPEIPLTTEHVAGAAARVGARLVHLSSDMVFDGSAPPYAEGDRPNPISPYGEAKLAAERAVAESGGASLIVRTSIIYGFEPLDHQTSWMVQVLERREPATLFVDEYRSPVWVGELADAIAELAGTDCSGTLHVAGGQRLSRWQFGKRILDHLGLDPAEILRPGVIADSGLRRPPDLTLDLARSSKILRSAPRGVDDVLAELRGLGPELS